MTDAETMTDAEMGRLMDEKYEQGLPGRDTMHGGALGGKMGIELLEVTAERVDARMPVAGNTSLIRAKVPVPDSA